MLERSPSSKSTSMMELDVLISSSTENPMPRSSRY